MKKILFLLLISLSCKAQTLTTSQAILYKAIAPSTIKVRLYNTTNNNVKVYLASSDSVYANGEITGEIPNAFSEYTIVLGTGDVIVGYASTNNAIKDSLFQVNTPIVPLNTIDNTLANLLSIAQGAVGKRLADLTQAERNALQALQLYKDGAVDTDGRVKKLGWAKPKL